MATIAVVDYGMGNLRSVAKALEHVAPKHRVVISGEPAVIDAAERVVFPGQGAMPDCMAHLAESGLTASLLRAAQSRPLLGVCVGEHMLMDESDESASGSPTPGLGLFKGRVQRLGKYLEAGRPLKVPHMGWNRVEQAKSHPIWAGIENCSWFYFVHSFYAVCNDEADVAATTDYGLRFTCAIARDNIFATQFHPEKSASMGLKLYENFVHWKP